MVLGYGLCARCDLIDVVLAQDRPLCRWCDPRLADLLAERLAARRQVAAGEPKVIEFRGIADPTGREWAA